MQFKKSLQELVYLLMRQLHIFFKINMIKTNVYRHKHTFPKIDFPISTFFVHGFFNFETSDTIQEARRIIFKLFIGLRNTGVVGDGGLPSLASLCCFDGNR